MSESVCECGHAKSEHAQNRYECSVCPCGYFTCAHANGLKNVRPWGGADFNIGECVDCNSTITERPKS